MHHIPSHPAESGDSFQELPLRAILSALDDGASPRIARRRQCDLQRAGRPFIEEGRPKRRIQHHDAKVHHGEEQAAALAEHHLIVEQLAVEHGWSLAVKYDVSQRELAAANTAHHLGSIHLEAVMKLQLQVLSLTTRAPEPFTHQQQSSSRKRTYQDTELPALRKRIALAHCF